MKKLIVLSALFFAACSSEPEVISIDNTVKKTVANNENVIANTVADIGISGMVCEMNCVSSVKQELLSMAGITDMEIDFDETADINHAIVKFDNKLTSEEKIVDAIEALNDNSYKVETFTISPLEGNTKTSGDNQVTGKTVESASVSPSFELPNVLDLFQVII